MRKGIVLNSKELVTPRYLSSLDWCEYTPQQLGTLLKLGLITGRKMDRTTLILESSLKELVEYQKGVDELKGISW